jgi:LuxR family transcriptional regulator, maltose regulon positive regulatory protein
MAGPLLETKFHVPRRRHGAVARPRLTERVGREAAPLTLLWLQRGSARRRCSRSGWPIGPARRGCPSTSDPALFWTYVATALHTVTSHEVGAGALSLLQGAQPPLESVVATLVNDLDAVCDDVVLVLDDFHVVEGREVHEGPGVPAGAPAAAGCTW